VDPRAVFNLDNWDGQTLCPRTDCFKAYNTVYGVKYPFFAQFLTPIGAQNPLISRSVKAVKKESSFLNARARKENCIPERNLLWNHSF
jgi:hypothetical protein